MANWIATAVGSHKGALHRALGIPVGNKIPKKKIAAAAHSDNPKIAKEANLAKTLAGFHKG